MQKKDFGKAKQLHTLFFIFTLIITISTITVDKLYFEGKIEKVAKHSAAEKLDERITIFNSFIDHSTRTLHSIRNSSFFERFVTSSSKEDKENLEHFFLSFSNAHPEFMQLRYIAKNGDEIVRVDRDKEGDITYLLPEDKLQNKLDRYYFYESKEKKLERVWFSALDLNIERGQIEIPYKPTLRAILPINENGEFSGILIINYFMKGFLRDFTKTPLYDMILFDDNGNTIFHYLHNSGSELKCWGNSLPSKYNIAMEYPNDYEAILSKDFLEGKNFVSKKSNTEIYHGLNILLKLKDSYIKEQNDNATNRYITITIINFVTIFFLTLIIVKFFSNTLLNLKELRVMNFKLERANKEIQEKTNENMNQLRLLEQQSKLAAMGEMISAIAHQWRQPLNELGIRIQKLKYDFKDNKIDEEFISDFIKNSKDTISFMSGTIDDFRNFFSVNKTVSIFSIKEAINDVKNMVNSQLIDHNIQLKISGDDFSIESFESEFKQVVLNIVINAKDAFEEKNIKDGKIEIILEDKKILIKDNAGGIPIEVIDRIFEPYFTTKGEGKGTGIGLYMSKTIIESNMNGKISVENAQEGAVFVIDFTNL